MSLRKLRVAFVPLLVAGCAGLGGGLHVDHARTGEIVVHAASPVSFERLAGRVYGDESLGPTVALIAHLPHGEGVPRGTVLVLPPRERLEERLRAEQASERHFEQGLAAADAGSFHAAADHFRSALREAPGRVDVRYNLGLALMQAGELAKAATYLEAVALARPGDADSRYALGSVMRRRRAHRRAYEEFDAAVRLDRRHANAAFARARTLEDLDRPDRAERAWKDFLRDFPESPLADQARRSLEDLRREPADAAGGP